jgi:two-component system, OmpR family, response regulator RegX3
MESDMRVLIASADQGYTETLRNALRRTGCQARTMTRGDEVARICGEPGGVVDAVLIDLELEDGDALQACRRIRAVSPVPLLVVAEEGDEMDRVLCLQLGADDFVPAPCGERELGARIQAVLRRARGDLSWRLPAAAPAPARVTTPALAAEVRELGPLRVDVRQRVVAAHGRPVSLTRKEFDVLALLAADPGRVFTREEIMRAVWGHDGAGDTRTLGVHMTGLRRKLGLGELIETVRGVGFRLACGAGTTAVAA